MRLLSQAVIAVLFFSFQVVASAGQGLEPSGSGTGGLGNATQTAPISSSPDSAGSLGNSGSSLSEGEEAEAIEEAAEETVSEDAEEKALAPAAAESMMMSAASSPAGGIQPPDAKPEPNFPQAKGNGSLNYRLPIPMPDFRGLQPDIALNYNSSRKTKTSGLYQGWLGYGWGLEGFSVIERGRPRNGVPSYAAEDVHYLNGVQLVACGAQPQATTSPSCQAGSGGTHSTEVESYQRIRFDETQNTWEITARDGTKTIFQSVGVIATAGTLTPGTDAHDIAYRYRWLVTSVVDTHGNTVAFTYTCPELPTCYPEVVSYPGAELRFYRQNRPDHLLVANGRKLSRIGERVVTIKVLSGGALKAAYTLEYNQAPISNASRLTKVRQYGSDATVSATGVVSGGSARPQTVFAYKDFAAEYDEVSAGSGSNWSWAGNDMDKGYALIDDLNNDGRHEVISGTRTSSTAQVRSFSTSNVVTIHNSLSLPTIESNERQIITVGRFLAEKKETYAIVRRSSGGPRVYAFNSDISHVQSWCSEASGALAVECSKVTPKLALSGKRFIADPEGDGVEQIFHSTYSGLVVKSFYGDGKDRLFTTSNRTIYEFDGGNWISNLIKLRKSNGSNFSISAIQNAKAVVGDYNGDGVDDIFYSLSVQGGCSESGGCSVINSWWIFLGVVIGSFCMLRKNMDKRNNRMNNLLSP